MAARSVKLKDLRAATEASVKAVLGGRFVTRPGVLVGLWIDRTSINKLDVSAGTLAKNLAKQVSVISGIKVTPGIRPGKGGVLVGFIPPRIMKPGA